MISIGLYGLFFDGMILAFGSTAIVVTIIGISNYIFFNTIVNYNSVSSALLAILPLIFGTIIGSYDLGWGLGIFVLLEALFLIKAFDRLFE